MKTLKITESDREGNTETIFHGTHPLSRNENFNYSIRIS